MEKLKSGSSNGLPPGFRFHPTDEELIMYYLINHATLRPCPIPIISQVDIYKFNPWELPEKAAFGEREWYFFSLRDRKYPNGTRPNRTAASGYWKATGTDKAIYSGSKYVGVKKALVFNKGRSPKGEKTDWIMHEYRLSDSITRPKRLNRSTKLDDWALCKIYKKRHHEGIMEQKLENSGTQNPVSFALIESDQELKIPSSCSLLSLSEFDYQSISCTLSESSFGSSDVFQICNDNRNTECSNMNDFQLSSMPYQFMNIAEFRV